MIETCNLFLLKLFETIFENAIAPSYALHIFRVKLTLKTLSSIEVRIKLKYLDLPEFLILTY